MTEDALVIRTDDLTKHYGRKVGCEKVCLRVRRGHIFGFLGPNGAGKSTFVKMMVGLHAPTSGTAELLGRPLRDASVRARLGFLPENFRYQDWLTPRELLHFHGRLLGIQAGALTEATARVLAEVGVADDTDTKIRSFSKGMQQRLGLACALLSSPEVLFLDEPTSALDPVGRAHVRELLCAVRERGTTVFLNSHLLSEVEMVCDEVAVIDHGRVVKSGSLDTLLAGPCEVEVTFAVELPAGVEDAIDGLGGHVVERGATRLVIGLPGEDAIPALVERLVGAGARIAGVTRRRRTLEHLFMEAVGEAPHGS